MRGKKKKGRNRELYYISPTFSQCSGAVNVQSLRSSVRRLRCWQAPAEFAYLQIWRICKFDVFAYFQSRSIIASHSNHAWDVFPNSYPDDGDGDDDCDVNRNNHIWTGWLAMSALDEGMTMRRCLLEDRYPGWVNRSVSHITQTVNSHSILKWNINVNFSAMQAKLDLLPNLWIFTILLIALRFIPGTFTALLLALLLQRLFWVF